MLLFCEQLFTPLSFGLNHLKLSAFIGNDLELSASLWIRYQSPLSVLQDSSSPSPSYSNLSPLTTFGIIPSCLRFNFARSKDGNGDVQAPDDGNLLAAV